MELIFDELACKCRGETFEEHLKKIEEGYPAHIFNLHILSR